MRSTDTTLDLGDLPSRETPNDLLSGRWADDKRERYWHDRTATYCVIWPDSAIAVR